MTETWTLTQRQAGYLAPSLTLALALAGAFATVGCQPADEDGGPDAGELVECDPATGDAATVPLRGSCPLAEHIGGFVIDVQPPDAQPGFSFVDGKVADGVVPVSILEEEQRVGDCRLMRKRFPFCDPSCQSGDTCDFDGTCIPYPERQDIGDVCIAGLERDVFMAAEDPYHYFDTQLPHPAFQSGSVIELTTTAGVYGALTLHGVGVTPLQMIDDSWLVSPENDLAVAWNPPEPDARSAIHMTLTIDQHGSSPLTLECDFADDGAATVPSELIEAMFLSGISGFPNGQIARRTVDSVEVADGCIDMVVQTMSAVSVQVDGHTPCNEPEDCPAGQTCDIANQTCV